MFLLLEEDFEIEQTLTEWLIQGLKSTQSAHRRMPTKNFQTQRQNLLLNQTFYTARDLKVSVSEKTIF